MQEGSFTPWVREYMRNMFPKGDVPLWVREAMDVAGIDLEGIATAPVKEEERQKQRPGLASLQQVAALVKQMQEETQRRQQQ